ncbi:SDR family NAD(P)-dependent oxidoreductase [Agrobacterium tumefaciens]|uniref:SDR family NAD(P)-dependent oxidoreductase n=1 Tax=Agrobacterium tumefaciens TaxID=358 RepID=UPI00287F1F0B|nr:SDR family NAD(P)-dependent oxidoreductase [Agrobacterium tumefaciens]MDS7598507.1 SDR family NAD(P)-dependent oxidoreductase [Agrobacterium tumefaciens]
MSYITQKPLGTRWGPASTAAQVASGIDLRDHVVIVTGGASGLGLETTKVLASIGAKVIVATRNAQEARQAVAEIPGVEVHELDLMNPKSIDRFASDFLVSDKPLSRLILNAGVMATPLFRDEAGNEGQFSTNHLGHFRLAVRLWPALVGAKKARIIVLSSRGHMIPGFDLDDLAFVKRPYEKWAAYGQAKTANSLFAVAADKRGKEKGIRAFAVHPGSIVGPLARHLSAEEIASFDAFDAEGRPIIDPTSDRKNFAQGAATTVWCATTASLDGIGGVYCENCDVASVESEERVGVRPYAVDSAVAERLWEESLRLTGLLEV